MYVILLQPAQRYAEQLDQVKQQYHVGLKTVTDVYTAQASYESSVAQYIAAENQLANDKENLRAITGTLYDSLARLKENFPLVQPQPINIDAWVRDFAKTKLNIQAARYAAQAAKQTIKQQFAGHLPSLNVQGIYNQSVTDNSGVEFLTVPRGSAQSHSSEVLFNLTVPLVQGGQVVAQTIKLNIIIKQHCSNWKEFTRHSKFNAAKLFRDHCCNQQNGS